jgi:hypothetical protein
MGLKKFEGRLERLVEGSLGRPFRSTLQPVEIGRRLTREMDLQRRVGFRGSLVAPNSFSVSMASIDVERFAQHLDTLVRELAEAAREHAEIESYTLLGPITVDIFESARVKAGQIDVVAEVVEGDMPFELVLADGRRFSIGETALVIGRLPEVEVVLDDPNVSRRHAEIFREGAEMILRDLGSTNGTKVNGTPISMTALVDGDQIIIGATRMTFEAP